jgi:hypothetical protein
MRVCVWFWICDLRLQKLVVGRQSGSARTGVMHAKGPIPRQVELCAHVSSRTFELAGSVSGSLIASRRGWPLSWGCPSQEALSTNCSELTRMLKERKLLKLKVIEGWRRWPSSGPWGLQGTDEGAMRNKCNEKNEVPRTKKTVTIALDTVAIVGHEPWAWQISRQADRVRGKCFCNRLHKEWR